MESVGEARWGGWWVGGLVGYFMRMGAHRPQERVDEAETGMHIEQ